MKRLEKGIAIAVIVICAVVFVMSAISLIQILLDYGKADDFYDKLNTPSTTESVADTTEPDLQMQAYAAERMAFFDSVKAQYPNVVGYISIPAASIAYPVVQGTDNEYYAAHLISGEESASGSIFLDYRASKDPSAAQNLVVYGHSMNNKTMFYRLRDLFDEAIFREGLVEYTCENGLYIYAPFSVYVSTTKDPYYTCHFSDDESFLSFCEGRLGKSRFVETDEYDEASRILTLVTCSNSISNPDERYIYHAILKEYYPRTEEE